MMMTTGNAFALVLYYICTLYFLFLHVVLMREHGRYDIGKAIISTILTLVLTLVLVVVVTIVILFIIVQVGTYV